MILCRSLPCAALGALLSLALFAFAPDLFAAGLSSAETATDNLVDLLDGVADNMIYIGIFLAILIFLFSGLQGRALWGTIVTVMVGCWALGSIDDIQDFFTNLGG